jgi:regulator of protease activity HflC (stomatin/prohibitin superfamily)
MGAGAVIGIIILCIVVLWAIIELFRCIYVVRQQTVYILERLGKFHHISTPGIHARAPFVDRVASRMSLKVFQIDNIVNTKTLDNVFVDVNISLQYQVNPQKVAEAFYQLDNPTAQIVSYIEDAIRSALPKLNLDDAFSKQDDIALSVQEVVGKEMDRFGYIITKTLITALEPDAKIKAAMNAINEAQRQQVAAQSLAQAKKITITVEAEAEKEKMILRGEAIAGQRNAIIEGLASQVQQLQDKGYTINQVMGILMTNQYFDVLNSLATAPNIKTLLMPSDATAANDITANMIKAMQLSNAEYSQADVNAAVKRMGSTIPPTVNS